MKQVGAMAAAAIACAGAAWAQDEYAVPPSACYTQTEFTLQTRDGDDAVALAGSFAAPRGGGRRPTVLMITGSGDHVREQFISGVPTFGLIADALARAGYNVVRTDARGFGASTINGEVLEGRAWVTIASPARYRDNQRLIDMLLARADVDPEGLIVMGHSEGAMIAARLAADNEAVDLAVLMSNSAAPGAEVFARQRADFMIARGVDPAVAERVRLVLLDYTAFLAERPADDAAFDAIAERFLAAQGSLDEPFFDRGFLTFFRDAAWYRYFVGYDPNEDLSRVAAPVLAFYGGADEQTPWRTHAPALTSAMAAAGNADYALHVLPDQDHFFLEFEGRRVDRHPYGQTRLSNEFLTLLISELGARFGERPLCTD